MSSASTPARTASRMRPCASSQSTWRPWPAGGFTTSRASGTMRLDRAWGPLPERLSLHPHGRAPQPLERTVVEALHPGLAPQQDHAPDREHDEIQLRPLESAVEAKAEAAEDQHRQDARAKIVAE